MSEREGDGATPVATPFWFCHPREPRSLCLTGTARAILRGESGAAIGRAAKREYRSGNSVIPRGRSKSTVKYCTVQRDGGGGGTGLHCNRRWFMPCRSPERVADRGGAATYRGRSVRYGAMAVVYAGRPTPLLCPLSRTAARISATPRADLPQTVIASSEICTRTLPMGFVHLAALPSMRLVPTVFCPARVALCCRLEVHCDSLDVHRWVWRTHTMPRSTIPGKGILDLDGRSSSHTKLQRHQH